MNLLSEISRRLQSAYPAGEARALARIVMEDGFNLSQTDILLGKDKHLPAESLARLENIIRRLLLHEPVQYILGQAQFMGHTFQVRPGCLIPRPETEELVDLVLHLGQAAQSSILDLCTGSGCIAVSLALALRNQVRITATDISPEALDIARANAKRLGATVDFLSDDLLNPTPQNRRWDIIVSNPPYVRECEKSGMEANVLEHEPHLALFVPDNDALRFYKAIARYAQTHLRPGGTVAVEINRFLSPETAEVFKNHGFIGISIHNDRYNAPRILQAHKAE